MKRFLLPALALSICPAAFAAQAGDADDLFAESLVGTYYSTDYGTVYCYSVDPTNWVDSPADKPLTIIKGENPGTVRVGGMNMGLKYSTAWYLDGYVNSQERTITIEAQKAQNLDRTETNTTYLIHANTDDDAEFVLNIDNEGSILFNEGGDQTCMIDYTYVGWGVYTQIWQAFWIQKLPEITNLKSQTVNGDVVVTWDAVEGAATYGYGVYNANDETVIEETVVSPTVTLSDLAAGTYSFVVLGYSTGYRETPVASIDITVDGGTTTPDPSGEGIEFKIVTVDGTTVTDFAKPFNSDFSVENGVYTISNFLNSNSPVLFTLKESSSGRYDIVPAGANAHLASDASGKLLTPLGDALQGKIYDITSNAVTNLSEVWGYFNGDSYATLSADGLWTGYISVIGFDSDLDDYTDNFTVMFQWGNVPENPDGVEFELYGYDWDTEEYYQLYKSFYSDITNNGGACYTIKDFCNSGYPLNIKMVYDETEGYYFIDFDRAQLSDVYSYEDPDYPGEEYWYGIFGYKASNGVMYDVTTKVYNLTTGKELALPCNVFYLNDGWSWAEYNNGRWEAQILFYGGDSNAEWWTEDIYASFAWDDAEGPDKAGIDRVERDDNPKAPVEYYNLQGVRVAQPTHGLYIKRQGSKVTKVIL